MKVLMVGVSVRPFAASAAAAGHEVVALDYFADRDQAPGVRAMALDRDFGLPGSPQALRQAASSLVRQAEAIAFGAGIEQEPALAGLLPTGERLGNSAAAVRGVRDLRRLKGVLAPTPVHLPRFILPGEPLPVVSGEQRWLLKDLEKNGGAGVSDWDGHGPICSGSILQEYIPGALASAVFLANGRQAVILGLSLQLAGIRRLGARRYTWCGNLVPLRRPALERKLEAAANALAAAFGLVGINGIDFIVHRGTPYLLEVNPRYPASAELLEKSSGANLFRLHLAACRGRLPGSRPKLKPGRCWGKAILYARHYLQTPDTDAWLEQGIADVPHRGEYIPAGAPICTLLANANSPTGCWHKLLANAARLEAELEGSKS